MHRLNALTKVAPAKTVIAGMIRGAIAKPTKPRRTGERDAPPVKRPSNRAPSSQPALSGHEFSLPLQSRACDRLSRSPGAILETKSPRRIASMRRLKR